MSQQSAVRLRGRPAVLDWMARLRVAGVDALAAGMGVTARQIHHHAAALERERLIRRPRVGDGAGGILVVTPKGVREPGREVFSRSPTGSLASLIHGRGVSWIAAHSERRGREWWGPSELREGGWIIRLPRRKRARNAERVLSARPGAKNVPVSARCL